VVHIALVFLFCPQGPSPVCRECAEASRPWRPSLRRRKRCIAASGGAALGKAVGTAFAVAVANAASAAKDDRIAARLGRKRTVEVAKTPSADARASVANARWGKHCTVLIGEAEALAELVGRSAEEAAGEAVADLRGGALANFGRGHATKVGKHVTGIKPRQQAVASRPAQSHAHLPQWRAHLVGPAVTARHAAPGRTHDRLDVGTTVAS